MQGQQIIWTQDIHSIQAVTSLVHQDGVGYVDSSSGQPESEVMNAFEKMGLSVCKGSELEYRKAVTAFDKAKPIQEITEDEFDSALCALPPIGLWREAESESFKLGEPFRLDVAFTYARVAGRFFRMFDELSASHEQIIARVHTSFPNTVTTRVANA